MSILKNTKCAEDRVVMQNVSILNSESGIDQGGGRAGAGCSLARHKLQNCQPAQIEDTSSQQKIQNF